jgi:prevent-host-death family protein
LAACFKDLAEKLMEIVNIHQAKINLPWLLLRVELGEEIILANRGIPIAKLVPLHPSSRRRNNSRKVRERLPISENINLSPAGEESVPLESS